MSTRAYPLITAFADDFEGLFPSAVCSGICGDRKHKAKKQGSYHLGREDCSPGTFSVVRPEDRAGNGPDDAAAAVDMSMNRTDMLVATRRLRALYANDRDPRRKYINAFNGWLGAGDAQRFDMVARRITEASSDHKGHVHLEIRRLFVMRPIAFKAVLSGLRGESLPQYLISVGVAPHPPAVKLPVPRYPGHVLQRSTKPDPAVKVLQLRLLARGWKSIGKPDSVFGPRTEDVVRRFQKTCRVPVDGKVGPTTWPLPWSRPLG